jgi:hypothetical protein
MKVPINTFARYLDEGGTIEADNRGGVLWVKGKAVEAWGNMRHFLGRTLRETQQ